ncbi:FliM/FliN family flagellar motor switch protein [Aquitalea aquatica]|uniref:FliM/FliN family flagellar motor switch protein n=1 Tax=Aquitalea aquatica TaxID=3044273 RepID=A0A838Y8I3_9NEIS|nr:FliM/FliN family flagellar motor C-terminal domain-containing protein [Aquitalea magnusonii]MBA4707104.1 FliM/FliN family flagellar motor switch protein [Aquitalea magnusonii]
MSGVLPFRLYTQKELNIVEAVVGERYETWLLEWGLVDREVQVSVSPVSLADVSAAKWLTAGVDWPAMSGQPGFFGYVCFDSDRSRAAIESSGLAVSVTGAAQDALAAAVVGKVAAPVFAGLKEGGQLDPLFFATGALRVALCYGDQILSVLLTEEQVARLLPRQALPVVLGPVSLSSLPIDGQIDLEVRASPAQFSIEDLGSLQPGDVIRLDQKVGVAFDLCLQSGGLLGRVQYGLYQGKPSVKVFRDDKIINKR